MFASAVRHASNTPEALLAGGPVGSRGDRMRGQAEFPAATRRPCGGRENGWPNENRMQHPRLAIQHVRLALRSSGSRWLLHRRRMARGCIEKLPAK